MPTSIENMARESVREILPDAVHIALESYRRFVRENLGGCETAKDTLAHHGAGKVAIAHINLLLKLSQWADLETKEIEGAIIDTKRAQEHYQNYLDEHEKEELTQYLA